MPSVYDACVVGGGPAGLSAARLMASHGLDVALVVEKSARAPREQMGQTLAPSAGRSLDALGLAEAFEGLQLVPIAAVHSSWGSDAPASRTRFEARDGLGWFLDRPAFGRMLGAAASAAGARQLSAEHVRASRAEGRWRIALRGATLALITSHVLVYAGGRRGLLQPPGRRIALDHLVASVAVVPRHELDADVEDRSIRIDALESGWMFSIAANDHARVITYFTDGDLLGGRVHETALAGLVSRCRSISPVVKPLQLASPHRAWRLSATTTFRSLACGPTWIACGDAAQTSDPLSSHGVADALLDGIETGQAVLALLSGERDAFVRREQSRRRRFAEYLRTRAGQYHAEQRWPGSPFWARRNSMASVRDFLVKARSQEWLSREQII